MAAIPKTLLIPIIKNTGFFNRVMSNIVPKASLKEFGKTRHGHNGSKKDNQSIKTNKLIKDSFVKSGLKLLKVDTYVEVLFHNHHP